MKNALLILALLATPAFADDPPKPEAPAKPEAKPEAPEKQDEAAVPHALVVHVAPTVTTSGEPIELEAMIDAPYAEALTVRWRPIGGSQWQDIPFERSSAGGWFASLPAAVSPGVEYYIRGQDHAGVEIAHFATEQSPHVVRVDPALFDRLETLDRARLGGMMNEVSLEVMAHDFGNRYDESPSSGGARVRDRFMRAELLYTHKLLRQIHEIGFGFGSITGRTPILDEMGDVLKGMRYGFGQVTLRVHPSVFLETRAGLGVSQLEFQGSGRAALTFGKPWRSNVSVGGEYIGDLGGSGWVRLQWDTAPPLLMAASIVRTDLPGAIIDSKGLYIAYDIAYRVQQRVNFKAQLSYGSRDGAAHFGGGLGTAFAF